MTYTNSKRGVSIVKRDHLIAEKHLFLMQETTNERCRAWVKYLRVENEKYFLQKS